MTNSDIPDRFSKLEQILKEYQAELQLLKLELRDVISKFRRALELERLKEVKTRLSSYEKS